MDYDFTSSQIYSQIDSLLIFAPQGIGYYLVVSMFTLFFTKLYGAQKLYLWTRLHEVNDRKAEDDIACCLSAISVCFYVHYWSNS